MLALAVLVSTVGAAACSPSPGKPLAHPTLSPPTVNRPSPGQVRHYSGYSARACGPFRRHVEGSLLTAQRIAGRPGARGYVRTAVVDAGLVDVRDGELWQGGGEALPDPAQGTFLDVPRGRLPVALLVAMPSDLRRFGWGVAAVEVRVSDSVPVRWVQKDKLSGGTDGGELGIGGYAAVRRLAAVRTFDSAQDELGTSYWYTPCQALTLESNGAAADALMVELTGDGGWPGAVGYDAAGAPVDVVISTGELPWSLLGLPGAPPPQAVTDEPTPTTSSTR